MEPSGLIPTPDSIPAPAWIFEVLDYLLFAIHIILINIVLGGSLLITIGRLISKNDDDEESVYTPPSSKLPIFFALAINFGVAPLLFMQVLYGHLFYTSSVLIAVFWILIIPLLIIAYYGSYFHRFYYEIKRSATKAAIFGVSLILLYIAFIFTNNMTLMLNPQSWSEYFNNTSGTILNLSDPVLFPRYLHFVIASIAVASLFNAFVWNHRQNKGYGDTTGRRNLSLKIFAIATLFQMLVGIWFLLSIPREYMFEFMGRNIIMTIVFTLALLSAIGAVVSGFRKKLRPTIIMILTTIFLMLIMRAELRHLYLQEYYSFSDLTLNPQYLVFVLFLLILGWGIYAIKWMLGKAFEKPVREEAE